MPNRHVPHSHVSPPPKTHKPCHHCRKPVLLQHVRPKHECTEHCHTDGIEHDYRMEQMPPLTRYFDDAFNEMCYDCAIKPAHKRKRHVAHG
jgi:hypothetical protein